MQVYQEEPWKESLFGCLTQPCICWYGCCCCCCLYGQNVSKFDRHANCLFHSCLYSLMTLLGCCCFLHAFKRGQIREKYGLEENTCGDCFITCCCAPCALCQEARELKARGYPPPPIIIIHQPALSMSNIADFDMNNQEINKD